MSLEDTPVADVETPVVDETPIAQVDTEAPATEPTEENKTPPTMEDTIRAKFRELTKPVVEEQPPDGKVRDAKTGRYVDKPVDTAVTKPPVSKPADGAQPAASAVAKAAVTDTDKAPTSWRGAAQAKFAALDPEIKAEVHKRETDFHKGLSEMKPFADLGKQFHAEFQPYEALIRASGHTPQSLTRAWMNTEYQLKNAQPIEKAALFVKYAKDYGIDMGLIQEAATKVAAGEPVVPPVDPRVAALEQSLKQVTTHIEQEKTQRATSEYKAIESETKAFAQKPENKHFEAVKLDMAALMESGRATTLQDAYDKACWTNPETRALLQAEQQTAERAKAAEKAAAAKRAASTNVATRGTLPSKSAATKESGTMEDTIRANLRAIQARAGA